MAWVAFALALLALGGACGYEYANGEAQKRRIGTLSAILPGQPSGKTPADELYSVNLQVSKVDQNLMVKWDRDAAPIQAALHGVLTVSEGTNSKEVKLGFAELRNGTAMYPHVAPAVAFRLELFFKENRSFVESASFKAE